ncbi:hypothetical protein [Streptomyces montanisoli]|uniref:Ribbon-helix-helix protein, CopG family n=1 Tax=Streptomyces montanisoli TaxID=2798581 RepID=A0A940M512_9ACTN|nr:hypothetical protein [Streptomyces montanisoli]MBP0456239.1 hypothetical protein [Streptomyces montanisoli]
MTTAKPTQPPKAGARPSIRVDDQLAADLAVLMSTGANLSDAIRTAVGQAADMYRTAWAQGVCPPATAPVLLAYQMQQQPTGNRPASSGYDRPSDARPTPRGMGRRLPAPPVGRILHP